MTEKETRDVCSPLSAGQSKQADNLEREIEGQAIEMDEQQIQSHHTTSSQPLASKARTTALVVTLTGAAFLNTLTVQAVVIVLPTIGKALNIPVARQQWIVSAYSLSFGCFLLLWGRLADVYGKRLIFILGSLWVAILTLINPFATNEIAFDLLRGLQGIGAAANVPTAIALISATFPSGSARNYAFSIYASGAPMGSIMGNLLGGLVAQYGSWRWIFWILSIMAFIVTAAGYFIIPKLPPQPASDVKSSIDWIGAFLVTVGVLVLLFAMAEGNVVGWSRPYIPVLIVLSVLFIVTFVFWQLYLEQRSERQPLMKVTMFKRTRVSAAMLAMAVFFSAFNNYLIFSTYFYQEYLGLSAIQTTVRFVPTGVVGILTILVTSRALARVPINILLMWGMACVGLANLGSPPQRADLWRLFYLRESFPARIMLTETSMKAVPIPPTETYWAYGFPAMCLAVFGADTLFPALLVLVAHNLPPEDQALGGGLINALGQIGRAVGLAIGTAIQVAVQSSREGSNVVDIDGNVGDHAYLQGLHAAQWLNKFVTIVLLSWQCLETPLKL
ncbi:drug resistance protein [Aureobasidium pullulans]|nr:drug resistance protein [Aureobasidium pullulans]